MFSSNREECVVLSRSIGDVVSKAQTSRSRARDIIVPVRSKTFELKSTQEVPERKLESQGHYIDHLIAQEPKRSVEEG